MDRSGKSRIEKKSWPDNINQPSDVTGRISGESKIVSGKNKQLTAYKWHM